MRQLRCLVDIEHASERELANHCAPTGLSLSRLAAVNWVGPRMLALGCALISGTGQATPGKAEARLVQVGNSSVLSISQPEDWALALAGDISLRTTDGGEIRFDVSAPSPLYVGRYPNGEAARAELVRKQRTRWASDGDTCQLATLEEQSYLGMPGLLVEHNGCSSSGGQEPKIFSFNSMTNDFEHVTASYTVSANASDQQATYMAHRAQALRILQESRLLPLDELAEGQHYLALHSTAPILLSMRNAYKLHARLSFYRASNWEVRVERSSSASETNPGGELILRISAPSAEDPDGMLTAYLALQGLPPGPLTASDFLATTPRLIEQLFAGQASETAAQVQRFSPFACLEKAAMLRSESTEGTHIRRYTIDADNGALSLQAYTAGGMTAAAHLLIAAPEGQLETALDRLQPLITSLRLVLRSPSISPFGKCGG